MAVDLDQTCTNGNFHGSESWTGSDSVFFLYALLILIQSQDICKFNLESLSIKNRLDLQPC